MSHNRKIQMVLKSRFELKSAHLPLEASFTKSELGFSEVINDGPFWDPLYALFGMGQFIWHTNVI